MGVHIRPVVTATTLGMMLANIPVLIVGDRIAGKLPVHVRRRDRSPARYRFPPASPHHFRDTEWSRPTWYCARSG